MDIKIQHLGNVENALVELVQKEGTDCVVLSMMTPDGSICFSSEMNYEEFCQFVDVVAELAFRVNEANARLEIKNGIAESK